MKGYAKLLIVVGIIVAVFVLLYTYDYLRMKTYAMEMYSISPEEPVADVKQQVTVVIKLTKNGVPVKGHTLFALAMDGGQMRGNRSVTDEYGMAAFTYIPYTESRLLPAKPVRVEVVDESNSVFIEVNAKYEFYINLKGKDS